MLVWWMPEVMADKNNFLKQGEGLLFTINLSDDSKRT